MTPGAEARQHLRKALAYLEAAQQNLDAELNDPATSNAVLSGIHAADAICCALTGSSGKTGDHADALRRLKAAGPLASPHATALNRLLAVKNQSQYQSSSMTPRKATDAVAWARRLHDAARDIVTSG